MPVPAEVIIRNIDWQDTLPIRHQVLWPDKPESFCRLEDDGDGLHFGAFIDEQLVCVASVFVNDSSARLRKFATLQSFQGMGIGSQMLQAILAQLGSKGISEFWCDARESAMSLYQRHGMEPFDERFYKSSVPYFKMRRVL